MKIIQDEVLKRDILEGRSQAQKKVKKYERKLIKSKTKSSVLKQAPIVDTSNFSEFSSRIVRIIIQS